MCSVSVIRETSFWRTTSTPSWICCDFVQPRSTMWRLQWESGTLWRTLAPLNLSSVWSGSVQRPSHFSTPILYMSCKRKLFVVFNVDSRKFLAQHNKGIKWKGCLTLISVSTSCLFFQCFECFLNDGTSQINTHLRYILGPNTSSAYGATLIEHSLIEVGLPGSAKVDSQTDIAQGTGETWLITVAEQWQLK